MEVSGLDGGSEYMRGTFAETHGTEHLSSVYFSVFKLLPDFFKSVLEF